MEHKPILLVIEDDLGLQRQLKWSYEEYNVVACDNRLDALDAVRIYDPPVVTLDLGLPPDADGTSEGFSLLKDILKLRPHTKIIVASGHGARESALRAIAEGAYDFYQKPIDIETLRLIVHRAFHVSSLEQENQRLWAIGQRSALEGLITNAPAMLKVCQMIERVATTDISVMLLGASGTGKEVLARALHAKSRRSAGPFIAINCAAIPENLLEAELFGHEKGAFTGAFKTTEGKIELAQKGTLFLDEVGDIPLPLQVKLLRFIQERVIERIGGRKPISVDVRIICATHQNLEQMIIDQRFREDLYYRLAEVNIKIPSLCEREGDAILLAHSFLRRFSKEMGRHVKGFSPDGLDALALWSWPGNVRELENRIKRAVIMCEGGRISAQDLDLEAKVALPNSGTGEGMIRSSGVEDGGAQTVALESCNLRHVREEADRKAIRYAVARADGNISAAAKLLGISRPTFYDLIKQYNISL